MRKPSYMPYKINCKYYANGCNVSIFIIKKNILKKFVLKLIMDLILSRINGNKELDART